MAGFTLLHAATYPGMWPEWLAAAGQPNLVPRHSLTLEHFYLTLQGALDGAGVAMGRSRSSRTTSQKVGWYSRSATRTAAVALLHVRGLGTRERRRGAGIQDWLKVAGNTAAPGVRN